MRKTLGAVNTVVPSEGRRIGHNTEWSGFAESFRRELRDVPRDRVVLPGACGAGSAVAHALLTLGAGELAVVDNNSAKADGLAAALRERFDATRAGAESDLRTAVANVDDFVNATPTGMAKYPGRAEAAWRHFKRSTRSASHRPRAESRTDTPELSTDDRVFPLMDGVTAQVQRPLCRVATGN